jgi:N-acetylmuramoyl-L-alanine amidase
MTLRRYVVAAALACAASLVCAVAARPAAAAAPPAGEGVSLMGLRSWASPLNTRLVFDFSAEVVPVAPDSGRTRQLVVSLPVTPVQLADSVRSRLIVKDGAVDSLLVITDGTGARFIAWFAETTMFRVFTLPAEEDKPFRLVIDVSRPGAEAAEAQRLAALASQKKRDRLRLIAIDAGHGGEDTGARGARGNRNVVEKNVTLAVARSLASEINQIPGLKAVLTRDGDYFIPLVERYRIAERMKADLFVSVHCNSSKRRGSGSGTEVYFLSLKGASDQADSDLADVENAADLVGGVPPQAGDELVNILYDVKRSSAMQQSQLLAETLLDHLAEERKLESRGVKQAGFVVLKSVEFPSVLVETAFINNPVEVKLLRDPTFQKKIAKQLATGLRDYFRRAGIGIGAVPAPASPAPTQ